MSSFLVYRLPCITPSGLPDEDEDSSLEAVAKPLTIRSLVSSTTRFMIRDGSPVQIAAILVIVLITHTLLWVLIVTSTEGNPGLEVED